MFFICFLCFVTVCLTALQFIGPQLLCLSSPMFNFYFQHPPHTPSTPSPTDSISGGEPMYLAIPFPTPSKPQRLLEKLPFFFFPTKRWWVPSGRGTILGTSQLCMVRMFILPFTPFDILFSANLPFNFLQYKTIQ